MSDTELKCCPLCGKKAVLYGYGYRKVPYCVDDNCRLSIAPKFGMTKENIEIWNNRKPVERIVEKLNDRIEKAGRIIVENPADMLDKIVNDSAADFIQAYEEAIEIVQKGGAE